MHSFLFKGTNTHAVWCYLLLFRWGFICSWKGFLEVTRVSGLWCSSLQLSLHMKETQGSVTPQPPQYWYCTMAVEAHPQPLIHPDSPHSTWLIAGVSSQIKKEKSNEIKHPKVGWVFFSKYIESDGKEEDEGPLSLTQWDLFLYFLSHSDVLAISLPPFWVGKGGWCEGGQSHSLHCCVTRGFIVSLVSRGRHWMGTQ